MIKNIVFDLGNVIVEFKPKDYMKRLNFNEEKINKLFEIVFKDVRWSTIDRGDITNKEYIATLKLEHPEYAEELDLMFSENWTSHFLRPKTASIEFLKKCAENYNIYILSNIAKIPLDYIKTLGFWDKVNGVTASYKVKSLKPENKIYTDFIKTNNLNPTECLFLDDIEENIEAAKKLGMHGIIFKDNINEITEYLEKNNSN